MIFFDKKDSEDSSLAIVCDAMGNIVQIYIEDLIVTQIDGQHITEILPKMTNSADEYEFEAVNNFQSEIKSQDQDNFQETKTNLSDLSEELIEDDDEDWI